MVTAIHTGNNTKELVNVLKEMSFEEFRSWTEQHILGRDSRVIQGHIVARALQDLYTSQHMQGDYDLNRVCELER